tara:strand:+ start:159 stop:389 length:231 start_codon:yes stop_codon:yes gene_type:complete
MDVKYGDGQLVWVRTYYDDMIPKSSFVGIVVGFRKYCLGSSSGVDHIIYEVLNLDDGKIKTAEEFAIQVCSEENNL